MGVARGYGRPVNMPQCQIAAVQFLSLHKINRIILPFLSYFINLQQKVCSGFLFPKVVKMIEMLKYPPQLKGMHGLQTMRGDWERRKAITIKKTKKMAERSTACEKFPLHKAVFEGNLRKVSYFLRVCDVGGKDLHGKRLSYILVIEKFTEPFQLVVAKFAGEQIICVKVDCIFCVVWVYTIVFVGSIPS